MKIKIPFEKLEFNNILSNDVYSFKKIKDDSSFLKKLFFLFKKTLTVLHKSIFYSPSIKKNSVNLKIFYIRTFDRPDIKINSFYYEQIEGTTVCILSRKIKKINLDIFINTIVNLFKSRKYWMKVLQKNEIKLLSYQGFFLLTILYEAYSQTSKILPLALKHEKLVSSQQCEPTENMICQLANLNKIETYGLQTSLNIYNESKAQDSSLISYDYFKILDYLNPVCKNILCWGPVNKSLYEKYTKANVHIIGKAGMPDIDYIEKGATIIFEQNMFEMTNNKLFQISNFLENNEIKVSRWFRKGNPLAKNGILRDGPLRKVVIGLNSTLLADLGFLGLEIYAYKGSSFENLVPSNLIINKMDELLNKFHLKNKYPHEIWKNFIECSQEESVKKYKSFLMKSIN